MDVAAGMFLHAGMHAMTSAILLILALLASTGLTLYGISEHRQMMAKRHRLLDAAGDVLDDARLFVGPDQLPQVRGRLPDGTPVRLEVMTDTLVTRRLPQLWLRVTLLDGATPVKDSPSRNSTETPPLPDPHHDDHPYAAPAAGGPALRPVSRPAMGVLARPTGAEYYSLVHDMPEWLAPPPAHVPMLMRGSEDAAGEHWQPLRQSLAHMVADPKVKEVVITPSMLRVMVQAAEGDRGAHLMLRQVRFAIDTIPAETLRDAIALATTLRTLANAPASATVSETGGSAVSESEVGASEVGASEVKLGEAGVSEAA